MTDAIDDRAAWLALRRETIGSSDTPAILGLDPFRSETDVYWSKCVEIPDEDKPQFELGRRLESVICDWAADRLSVEIDRNVYVRSTGEDKGIMSATLDARLRETPTQGMEAKFSSQSDEWGEEGTDQVPERVLVQAQHQIHVAGLELQWVPALVIGYTAEFRLYCVRRDDDLIREIVNRDVEWWHEYVEPRRPPNGVNVPPLAALKKRARQPNSMIELDEEAAAAWARLESARAMLRTADEAKDEATAAVVALLQEHEGGRLPDGRLVTYFEQPSPPRMDYAQFRACHQDLYDRFVSRSSHRTLRIKKAK